MKFGDGGNGGHKNLNLLCQKVAMARQWSQELDFVELIFCIEEIGRWWWWW
jgi:hypothetical protein